MTGINIDVAGGKVEVNLPTPQEIPRRIEHAVRTFPNAIEGVVRGALNPAGEVLATAIRHAQGQARHGSQSVPSRIRDVLAGIIPEDLLNEARWNSLDANRIDLANLTMLHNNDVAAITVGHIIVFDRREYAETNWKLCAHELYHVLQYRNMGIEAFAHTYILAANDIEKPAYEFADMVAARVAQRQRGQEPNPIQLASVGADAYPENFFPTIQQSVIRRAPATACLDIQDNNGLPTVKNVCSMPVWVRSFIEVERFTGQEYPGLCYPQPGITCEISPGVLLPVYTPRRGCVKEVRFSFFSSGSVPQDAVWTGDCPMGGSVTTFGQSCCMFNGGRCGPFYEQSALPIGSPCMCQYGNPYTAGQICSP
ncbi:MAG: eCIS core domain-containing protein [Candidatus Binatia bacterium]